MNLKQSRRKNGRVYLSIEKAYRDKDGKPRSKTIKSLGYLDALKKKYDDPIVHFREVARKMTEEEQLRRKVTLSIDLDEELPENSDGEKNFGYAAILKIYHDLKLDRFIRNKTRYKSFKFDTNAIMILLVVSRLLSPGSKKKAYEEKEHYFERFNFTLADIYRALSHYAEIARDLQRHLHREVAAIYGCNTNIIYYDVTNFYFEVDKADDLRKFGFSKENRPNPIVQMGLAMDADGIPLHYELFAGNTLDKETFRSVIGEVRRNYDTGRIVVVADMGIITGDNIYYLTGGKGWNGYVFSFSVRGGTKAFKEYVLDQGGYLDETGLPATSEANFKVKSRVVAREINVTMQSGKIARKTVYEKQVVFWSRKYADKAKRDREQVVKKALELVANPQKYNKATSYGAAKYVKNLKVDPKSGEVLKGKQLARFDSDRLALEERFDGYYAIVTSERELPNDRIIEIYRGLWEIEETFRITKGAIEARPVYVSLAERIEAHFLSRFIALVIIRLLQKLTERKYSAAQIIRCLNKITGSNEEENIYLFKYRSELSNVIGSALGIDFNRKRLSLGEIKNILAGCKR